MKSKKYETLTWGLLVLGGLITLFPFFWMVSTSFKTFKETVVIPPTIFPKEFVWTNYTTVIDKMSIWTLFINTFIVTFFITVLTVFISALGAYSLSRIDFKGKKYVLLLILSIMMVPNEIFLIPTYKILASVGLVNTLTALILPNIFSVFGVFLLYQFYNSIPRTLDEAAIIDGATHFQVFWKVILPLSKQGIVALGILTMLGSWKEFIWPIIINTSIDKMTVGAGIAQLKGTYFTEQNILMAAGFLSSLPMIIVFLFVQRQFMESVSKAGIKG